MTTMCGKRLAAILLVLALASPPLWAATSSSSSHGYSLPSAPSSSKGYAAPPARSAPSAASRSSNGYALPGTAPSGQPGAARVPQSGSDAALSRQESGAALKGYAAQREQSKFAVAASPSTAPSGFFSSHAGRFPSYDAYYANRTAFYGGRGWNPPPYVYASRPSFGIWDAMFMWFMLDSLSNAAHAAWFYHHADDPGYHQWRQEANRLAADNADLHAKLDALDARQQEMQGQPRDPSYMPPDARPDLALAPEHAVASEVGAHASPNWWLIIAVLAALACILYAYRGHIRRVAHH